jgi:hypothetical protein
MAGFMPVMSARGGKERGQQIEAGRLAGTVRADQGVDIPGRHAQGYAIDSHEAAEFPG